MPHSASCGEALLPLRLLSLAEKDHGAEEAGGVPDERFPIRRLRPLAVTREDQQLLRNRMVSRAVLGDALRLLFAIS